MTTLQSGRVPPKAYSCLGLRSLGSPHLSKADRHGLSCEYTSQLRTRHAVWRSSVERLPLRMERKLPAGSAPVGTE